MRLFQAKPLPPVRGTLIGFWERYEPFADSLNAPRMAPNPTFPAFNGANYTNCYQES